MEERLNALIQRKIRELYYGIDELIADIEKPYSGIFHNRLRGIISQLFRDIQDIIKCRDNT